MVQFITWCLISMVYWNYSLNIFSRALDQNLYINQIGYHFFSNSESPFYHREIKLEEAAVLHYTYTKFSDLTSRRDRCGCKPTKDDVQRCFMLEFDRAVSTET